MTTGLLKNESSNITIKQTLVTLADWSNLPSKNTKASFSNGKDITPHLLKPECRSPPQTPTKDT
ncbi:MAG: hypothetical protein ACI8PP_001090 [Candidatus Pseudothioglobus sp.]|jgi:hypothetical protein